MLPDHGRYRGRDLRRVREGPGQQARAAWRLCAYSRPGSSGQSFWHVATKCLQRGQGLACCWQDCLLLPGTQRIYRAESAPEASLTCLAGPFCHRVLLTLEEKNCRYQARAVQAGLALAATHSCALTPAVRTQVHLVDLQNKPAWLLDVNPQGSGEPGPMAGWPSAACRL